MPMSEGRIFELCEMACQRWLKDFSAEGLPVLFEVFLDSDGKGCWIDPMIPQHIWRRCLVEGNYEPHQVLLEWAGIVSKSPRIQLMISTTLPSGWLFVAGGRRIEGKADNPTAQIAEQDQILAAKRDGRLEELPGQDIVAATWYEYRGPSSAAYTTDTNGTMLEQWMDPRGRIIAGLAMLDQAYQTSQDYVASLNPKELSTLRKQADR